MKENWIDQIREKVNAHQEHPPIEIWEKIEKSKEFTQWEGGALIEANEKSKNLFRKGMWAASLVGIGLVSSALIYYGTDWDKDSRGKEAVAHPEVTSDYNNKIAENKNNQLNSLLSNNNSKDVAFDSLLVNEKLFVGFRGAYKQHVKELHFGEGEEIRVFSSSHYENSPIQIATNKVNFPDFEDEVLKLYSKRTSNPSTVKRENRISIGPLFGQGTGQNGFHSPGYYAMNGLAMPSVALLDSRGDFSKIFVSNLEEIVETKVNHKMPLSVGVGVNYTLKERWSLSSGVNYTHLSSELNAGTSSNYLKTKQDLHYIGVPLQLNYQLSKSDKVTSYGFAGGEVKKVVAGEQQTQYYINNRLTDQYTETETEKPIQVSLRAGVGVEVPVYKSISFFVEPAVEYHLDDGTSLETVYKENPLNLTIIGGLRFTIDSHRE